MTFSEADLNSVGRTKVVGTTEFDALNRRRLFFSANGTTYNTFKDCNTYLVGVS
jgi:hypothetical protein